MFITRKQGCDSRGDSSSCTRIWYAQTRCAAVDAAALAFMAFFFFGFPIRPNTGRFGPIQFDLGRNRPWIGLIQTEISVLKKQKKVKYFVKPWIGPILGLLRFTSNQGRRLEENKKFQIRSNKKKTKTKIKIRGTKLKYN